jgi:type II secretory pathway pseudopilin PulG
MNYELRIKKSRNAGFTRQNFQKKISGGYTIIETMISVSLFTIIVTIALGSLLNANLLHKKSQNMRSIMDNLNFVMEDMSRNLRVGYNYRCITNTTDLSSVNVGEVKSGSDCGGIAFTEVVTGTTYVYYVSADGKIFKSTQTPYDTLPPNPSSPYIQLTPDEIDVSSDSSFTVVGAESPLVGNTEQPYVTIKLVGSISTSNGGTSPFSLQTSVSQRKLDW